MIDVFGLVGLQVKTKANCFGAAIDAFADL
jgi:hypothetical protein